MLRTSYTPAFAEIFKLAMSAYIGGDWEKSRLMFEECLTWKPRDGPCQTILEFMRDFRF
jgi:hypothetical protein